ncbi:MAG: hypothetical protein IPP16_00605 [Acidimicrobiaceae bacterium]|nr:hypothetical protein [Acidimicrobiaceae bacterium]
MPLGAFLWMLRVLSVLLATAMAVAIGGATDGRSAAAGPLATAAWGLVVAALAIALVVPSPLGLTVLRLLLPATVPAAVIALSAGAAATGGVAAAALAALATVVAFSAETAEALVQGSAYGSEQRLPLRVPAAMMLPMALTWTLWCAATLGALVLLCAGRWAPGAPVAFVAGASGWLLARRFHTFSRRWLVVVPAGVVVHDHVVLAETLMMQRTNIAVARLAPAQTEAADLTGPAAGHVVEIVLREMALAVLAPNAAEPKGKALHIQSLLVAPSRPGRALQRLSAARVPVG